MGRDGTAFPAPILHQGSSTGSQHQAGSPGQSSAPQPGGSTPAQPAQLAPPGTPQETCPSLNPALSVSQGVRGATPSNHSCLLPPSCPTQAPGPHRVQQPRTGGEAPSPDSKSPTGTPVPGCIAPQPQAPRGCTAAGAGRGVGNGRNPALSHRFLCAVSHASSSEATRGRSGAHGCVRGQPLHARVCGPSANASHVMRAAGLHAGPPCATSSIACVHRRVHKAVLQEMSHVQGSLKRSHAQSRAHPRAGGTALVPTAAAPGVHRRWVGSSARPHLTPQP